MLYYYVMNRSNQYLNRNHLWQDEWNDQVQKSLTIPNHDTGNIGWYQVYEIEEDQIPQSGRILQPKLAKIPGPHVILNGAGDAFWSKTYRWINMNLWDRDRAMTFVQRESAEHYAKQEGLTSANIVQMKFRDYRDGRPPCPYDPKTDFEFVLKYGLSQAEVKELILDPASKVAASKRNKFLEEYKALAAKYEVRPFAPNVRYNHDGDQFEVYLTDELSYCDPVGPKAPGILIMRNMETKAITGVKIQCFLDRLCGSDPSRQAMIMDIEMVHIICEWYQERLEKNPTHTWKQEELEFFHAVAKSWPGMKHKFLSELPRCPG